MARIKIEKFAGQTPRLSSRLLAPEQAEDAVNCKLWSGELRPFKDLSPVLNLSGQTPPLSLHLLGGRFWLNFDVDVDAARCPVPGDNHSRTCLTGLGAPMVTDTLLTAAARLEGDMMRGLYLGVPAPSAAPVVRLNHEGSGAFESRAYVYTFVNQYGEEGPPSPPSRALDTTMNGSVLVTGMERAPAGIAGLDPAVVKRRVYRTETPDSGTAFYSFTAEIDARLTSFVDNKPSADLGSTLTSTSWYPPPADMRGLITLPNGIMAGFRGNELCFSEPLTPHAWPPEYRLVTDQPIVAMGAYDTTIVVATTAYAYLVTGSSPAAMSMSRLPGRQACVSKRGLVSSEAGVVYPSPDGLYMIGPKAGVLVTRDLFTRDEWQALSPETMHCEIHDGRLFVFYGDGGANSGGLVLDRAEPGADLVRLDFHAHSCFSDTENDKLYLAMDGPDGPRIEQWEGSSENLNFTWRSKTFAAPRPLNLAAAKVLADYPQRLTSSEQEALEQERAAVLAANGQLIAAVSDPGGALNGQALGAFALNGDELAAVPEAYQKPAGLDFKLFGDGAQRLSREVAAYTMFRLPAGYSSGEWQIEMSADFPVREARLAESAEELGE